MSQNEPTSVFTDDTGARARALVWVGRGLLGVLALGAAAVVFSLVTRVSLPGLDGPVHLPGTGGAGAEKNPHANHPEPTSSPTGNVPTSSSTASPTGASKGAGSPGSKPAGVTPVSVTSSKPSATPTAGATPTKGPKKSVKASNAPRAHPTHTPGSGQSTPPGKAK